MNPNARQTFLNRLAVPVRWLVGSIFIYTGTTKVLHPADFLKLIREYDVLHQPAWLNSIAALLPWLELLCGVLLLSGIAIRGTSLLLGLMLIAFTGLVAHRALAIMALNGSSFWAVQFDCGCGTGEILASHKIAENSILVLLLFLPLRGYGYNFCLRPQFFRELFQKV